MLSAIIPTALLGLSAVYAAPAPQSKWHPSGGQVPFTFPLSNGFPNIQIPSAALTQIEKQAHGTLPNGALAKTLAPTSVTNFELIAFNEIFEVAFFTSLLTNITTGVAGFEVPHAEKALVIEALTAVVGQEQLHALGANGILSAAGSTPIQPCEYIFPTATFADAINIARTFTDVVLGTLQDVETALATDGDTEYVGLIGAVIGQEGEQNGYYRSLLDLIPSELPFLTISTGPWAYSVLNQLFVVPGSCPNANIIDLPIFSPLTLDTAQPIQPKTQNLQFTFTNNGTDTSSISLVYTNQQNLPIVETPQNVQTQGDTVTFEAAFPYDEYIMNGLTIAVVTDSAGPFTSADEVAAVTLFGPALIEVL